MGAKPGKRRGIRRADNETLEPLSIRMSAKLKFGLELLARHQGRSVGQAIEWALQNSLAAVKVKNDSGEIIHSDSLLTILNHAWECSGWKRAYFLHYSNSGLVSFEERHACELIRESVENKFLSNMFESMHVNDDPSATLVELDKTYQDLRLRWEELIDFAWPELIQDANTLETKARWSEEGALSILHDFCFYSLMDVSQFVLFDEAVDIPAKIVLLSDILRNKKKNAEAAVSLKP